MIANQVVQKETLSRLAELVNKCHLMVCVDSKDNVIALESVMSEQGGTLYILVEFDVGMKRCGVKTMTMDQHIPCFSVYPNAELSFSEEYTIIFVENSGLKVGDRLGYIPGHCCTTINTFDKIFAVKNEKVVDVWDITSRSKAQ